MKDNARIVRLELKYRCMSHLISELNRIGLGPCHIRYLSNIKVPFVEEASQLNG